MLHALSTPSISFICSLEFSSLFIRLCPSYFSSCVCVLTLPTLHICKVQRVPQLQSTVNKSQSQHRVTAVLFPPPFPLAFIILLKGKRILMPLGSQMNGRSYWRDDAPLVASLWNLRAVYSRLLYVRKRSIGFRL